MKIYAKTLSQFLKKTSINGMITECKINFTDEGLVPIAGNIMKITQVLTIFCDIIQKHNKPIHFFGISGNNIFQQYIQMNCKDIVQDCIQFIDLFLKDKEYALKKYSSTQIKSNQQTLFNL